ncbi:MAG: right-handed parallel beta-helix repeat-containing protein [Sedimentisphaerales bacterium]|nr:right-handed parallel beta-helix repeat-containing protein [Sedimentisphaerales bacterium]
MSWLSGSSNWRGMAVLLVVLVGTLSSQGKVIYVDANAPGADDGTSWENAYNFLQDALADANSSENPVEIRVAQGTYKPDQGSGVTPGDRAVSFQLKSGASILGGYAGNSGANPDERNVSEYQTVLSGDLAANDLAVANAADLLTEPTREDNAFHVIYGFALSENTVLDGVYVISGNANGQYSNAWGGGISLKESSPTIIDCVITGNTGKEGNGITCDVQSSPRIEKCVISHNSALWIAGGINCWWSSNPILIECEILDNWTNGDGAGMYNAENSCPIIQDTIFERNTAMRDGGGMFNQSSSPQVLNCAFIRNSAQNGGGMIVDSGMPTLADCIFRDNLATWEGGGLANQEGSCPEITNCIFEGSVAYSGGGMANVGGSSPILNGCVFRDNVGYGGGGGGMFNRADSHPRLVGCDFTGNTGWGYYGGGMVNVYSSSEATNCTFIHNSTDWNGGGAACIEDSSSVFVGCLFEENEAPRALGYGGLGFGGGLFSVAAGALSVSNLLLSDCVFRRNYASNSGGGISGNNSSLTVNGCIFEGNRSSAYGGGVLCMGVKNNSVFSDCTFVGNSAIEGNAFASYSNPKIVLQNSVLWNGKQALQDLDSTTILSVNYSVVPGGWPGTGNIDTDPCFADPGYWDPNETPADANDDIWVTGDYHLKSQAGRYDPNTQTWIYDDVTSPCIDAGDPMSPIGAEPFPNGGIINMGAYGGTSKASKSHFGTTPCEIIMAGDINGDCEVNFLDFCIMALHWCEDNNP